MASNEPVSPYHVLQSSFSTGEISREVANRVDLDKYQFALTKAKNVMIRPYGPVYKRPGTTYLAEAKGKCMLASFAGTDNVDYLLEIGGGYIRIYLRGAQVAEVSTPYPESILPNLRFTQSADVMFIASGEYPLKTLTRNSNTSWTFSDYSITKPYFDEGLGGGSANCTITPSGISGNITLTSNENIFSSNMVGGYVKLTQDVDGKSIRKTLEYSEAEPTYTSPSMYVGESWKIITNDTWSGQVRIEYSEDNSNWLEYRNYTSSQDYNATESGSLTEGKYLRFVITLSWGKARVTLSRMPYLEEGYARITGYTNAKTVSASVVDKFGNTDATKQWAFSAWSPAYGYPKTVAFFQDRLCLGGSKKQPYMLWMSRSGDYNNFSVEKVDGKVTDDSAVALPFVSRKQFEIRHLVPNTDLIVLTKGNEWILSGNEVITPTGATPKMQTTRGCSNVEPIMIGNKTVFVQGRGSVVRDLGYSYETDSYGGTDLTLLDKQIVEEKNIVDATYMQEPNSSIYFVRDDGIIAVLSYVVDQKVFAWSTIETTGLFESVCAVAEGDIDVIYVVALRNGKRYLESFQNDLHSSVPQDYIMVDSAKIFNNSTATDSLTAQHLKNTVVFVLGDGREFPNIRVGADGVVKLPTKVKKATVGLPYSMEIELPNVEVKGRDGTMQGRLKTVPEVILRLYNTLGGTVATDNITYDAIPYDEYQDIVVNHLYSGDKKMQMPIGGFNTDGRVQIASNNVYPFNLLAVVREVSLGG